jgi:hypothetical protein
MLRMSFSHDVVVTGVGGAPMPHLLKEGRPKLPSLLDVMRISSVESSIMAHHGANASLQIEPMKVAPASPLVGEGLGRRSSQR